MTIFTDGKSTAINSPRHLTIRHAVRAVKLSKEKDGVLDEDERQNILPDLKPGEEILFSFWAPSLAAGKLYHINARQIVDPHNGEDPLQLDSEKKFKVEAPQFSLPADSIYSVYPPPGYSEDHRILPHVVLNDPHLPWERRGSSQTGETKADRNRVPWLALLLFTQDELKLAEEDRDGDGNIFTSLPKPVKQTSSLAVRMTLGDLKSTKNVIYPIADAEIQSNKDTSADFIFVKPDLLTSLFSPFSDDNKRVAVPKPDASPYKFLSHVRKINTAGMAVAGAEDVGIFSVVIANRSGPLDNATAVTVSAHLVSIEGVEDNITFPIADDKKYVALCSLHSWNYTVMPPNMLNVRETFTSLGETLGLLRPPDELINGIRSTATADNKFMSDRLANRLEDGYSLVRHRTQTGETTVALFRGPFTPTIVRRRWKAPENSESDLHRCSNSGIDLQILDKEVGIMDISYSVAWQVGRMLALADQVFATALIRLRTAIHERAMNKLKEAALRKKSEVAFVGREDILQNLSLMCAQLDDITVAGEDDASEFTPRTPLKWWNRRRLTSKECPGLGFVSLDIEPGYADAAIKAAQHLAKATDGNIYDETNNPVSADWMVVLAWVMNRMFLDGVPAHYLVTDPCHLEHERLQFFHIDANWTDALIDGALSLGNHMGEDRDRVAIKRALNQYIYEKPERLVHPPQVPTYGFYLRSDLVSMYPDLKVTTLPEPEQYPPPKAPLLRHEIIADGVMLGLLDRIPGSPELNGLVFTQPPHQQRFAVAGTLEADRIGIEIRRQYTVDKADCDGDVNRKDPLNVPDLPTKPTDTNNLFIWGSQPGQNDLHMLRLPRYADKQLEELNKQMGTFTKDDVETRYFEDDTATSALLGLQLNDPVYSLTVSLSSPQAEAALARLAPESGAASIRTLSLLEPPLMNPAVPEFTLDTPSSDDTMSVTASETTENDSMVASAVLDRPSDYVPAEHALYNLSLLPHAMPVHTESEALSAHLQPPTQPRSLSSAPTTTGDSRPARRPQYTCNVSSIGKFRVYVDNDNLPQDLIFSIQVSDNTSPDYKLKAFHLWVDLGEVNPNTFKLLANYDGPGPSMLSNLRFNVLPKIVHRENGSNALRLSLLPRSTKEYVNIPLVREMSFVLALAQVNKYPQDPVQFSLHWEAVYTQSNDKGDFLITVSHRNL